MCKVIPVHLVDAKIDAFTRKLVEISGQPFSESTVIHLQAQLALLNELREMGEQSADDWLTLQEAMEWSGLGRDALDNYPHIGSYSSKRWRRGDLPMRVPFSGENTHGGDASDEDAHEDEDAIRQRRLRAALDESKAA